MKPGLVPKAMSAKAAAYVHAAALSLAETLWPTRCAICDVEGDVLCERCRGQLPFIDQWKACPSCGAPFGVHECTECNGFCLRDTGYERLPLAGCVCALQFTPEVARVVRTHKDSGEQRLAHVMGFFIAAAVPPEWVGGATVSYIPATRAAVRRRGFDHGQAIAQAVSGLLHVPCRRLLEPPRTHDQRELSRSDRFANMRGAFTVAPGAVRERDGPVIVVDDVLTTGATLCAAAEALHAAGWSRVHAAGFARVY